MRLSEAYDPRHAPAAEPASRPIVIAGGGIAGLATAAALARHGRETLVLERASRPHEPGAGIQLPPNAVRVLMRLGLGVPLLDVAVRPLAVEIREAASGRLLGEMPLAGMAEARHGAPYCVLSRPALHGLLTEAAHRAGAVLRHGSEVEGFAFQRKGVAVEVAGAAPLMAEALVACDGLWSRLRGQIVPNRAPARSRKVAWRAILPPGTSAPAPVVTAWLAPRLHAVTYPMDVRGTLNLVVVTEGRLAETGWDVGADADEIAGRTAAFTGPLRDIVAAAGGWRAWPLFETFPPVAWGTGAMTLVGDAAHPMLPFAAQGAAMAIEDAWVLAETAASGPADLPAAFRAYERARVRRVGRVIGTARRNGWVFHCRWPLSAIRDRVLGARSGPALLASLDWLHGGGPVAPADARAHSGAT